VPQAALQTSLAGPYPPYESTFFVQIFVLCSSLLVETNQSQVLYTGFSGSTLVLFLKKNSAAESSWHGVGWRVGLKDGSSVAMVGRRLGLKDGLGDGFFVGDSEGVFVGDPDGALDGVFVGDSEGDMVRVSVGLALGSSVR